MLIMLIKTFYAIKNSTFIFTAHRHTYAMHRNCMHGSMITMIFVDIFSPVRSVQGSSQVSWAAINFTA